MERGSHVPLPLGRGTAGCPFQDLKKNCSKCTILLKNVLLFRQKGGGGALPLQCPPLIIPLHCMYIGLYRRLMKIVLKPAMHTPSRQITNSLLSHHVPSQTLRIVYITHLISSHLILSDLISSKLNAHCKAIQSPAVVCWLTVLERFVGVNWCILWLLNILCCRTANYHTTAGHSAATHVVRFDWSQPRRTGSFHGALRSNEMTSDEMRWDELNESFVRWRWW